MIISLREIVDVIIMTLALGYIFKDSFAVSAYQYPVKFNWRELWYAALITAPGVILHEFGHKIVALGYGLAATFHASYGFLLLGVILKMVNFGFIFFVPGYVSHSGASTVFQNTLIAFAGPGVNLVLWLAARQLYKQKIGEQKWHKVWFLTAKINMFLFFFNMLPIPPFDGWAVWSGLWKIIF
ncbi:MAG: M50 family metallopeptidase [Candidatus Woesearchaeota archaeon]|nr:M50 family metallopeptidase [Candidatus Woesearchaeota archaeon]